MAESSSANASPSLDSYTKESLQALPRRQLQILAKKHGVKANKKSEDIVHELLELKEEQDEDAGNIPVHNPRPAIDPDAQSHSVVSVAVTGESSQAKRRRVVRSEDVGGRSILQGRRILGDKPVPVASPSPPPPRTVLEPPLDLANSREFQRFIEQNGPRIYPHTPEPAFPRGTSDDGYEAEEDEADKENMPSAEEIDKENQSPFSPRFLPQLVGSTRPHRLETLNPDIKLEYRSSPIGQPGPSSATHEFGRGPSFSPMPRPFLADRHYMDTPRGSQATEENDSEDDWPVTNKEVRQFRRECAEWSDENQRMKAHLENTRRVLESIRATVDESKRIMNKNIIWHLCAIEDNILGKARTNRSIWDGTGFMKREEDNAKWRKIVKKQWEKKNPVSDDEDGGPSASGCLSENDQTGPRGLKRFRDETQEEAEALGVAEDDWDDMYL